ncbi:hypothetical protein BKA64DRAFT_746953 [Cadophora sp. MPI-SDFR-AT-0126]|nr:hypothetical protein BKA64DRAFT_746953 [Leotiomycetes sp. MPI-SDFR-AT-0126]
MRLFNTQKVQFIEVYGSDVPSYAILSHTWSDGEILLQDLQGAEVQDESWAALSEDPPKVLGGIKVKGFKKLLGTTAIARKNRYDYLWVDTCCIDKTSSAELSEAINSMYRWYAGADVCIAYLSDVPSASTESPFEPNSRFRRSRWFNRGWTLQELIASQQVELFASDWSYLGAKTGDLDFTRLLSDITGIQLDVLSGELSPQDMSIAARMHWAAERSTTREEDIAYCLLGIFDVNMPLLYGEGKRAFIRLQEAILTKEEDQSLFAWHSEPLPTSSLGDSGPTGGFSGLLAESPNWFWDHNDIETSMPMILKSSPSAVTSKGLRIDLLLLPCEEDDPISNEADFRVVLNCERVRDGQRESPVIYLKRIWGMGDQFARVRPDHRHFVPPARDLLDVGTHERIFVKQDPWTDRRTIRIVAAKDNSQLRLDDYPGGGSGHRVAAADWKIKDAWPMKGWAEHMQTFQTREFTFGIPCGVLRLEVKASGQPTTVDVAIGMHAPSERLSRSWCQIMNLNSFIKPESAFSWAKREAVSGKIVYNSLSTRDIHGTDVSTWVVVTERNRKGRLDITLHVLSDKPRPTDKQPLDRGYGHIIPISTLAEEELKRQSLLVNHHPLHHLPTRAAETWNYWQMETKVLMGEICVIDSIETSVFPRISFGSKVRIKARNETFPSPKAMEEYCLNALPADDRETRRLVEILFGYNEAGARSELEASRILDASRILEGRPDSFLQLQPVHWAVIGGQIGILQVLLDSAFLLTDVSLIDLLWATIHPSGEDTPATQLIQNLEPTINNEDYPIHFAAAYGASNEFWEPTELLSISQMAYGPRANILGERPIHRAAAMGNIAAVKNLVVGHIKVEVEALDLQGRTPLWHAACGDHTGAVAKILLNSGAYVDAADHNGLAPIHVACRQGTFRFLKRLRAGGANFNLPAGALCLLPSHFAAAFGHKQCLELLLDNRAKLVSNTKEGAFVHALHLAIANGHEACARAIWDALEAKRHFEGWSLCIIVEDSGPVLKWMYLQVNDQHWLAIEDPLQAGGTEKFVCFSKEDMSPKLWVRPGISESTNEEAGEGEVESDTDNDAENVEEDEEESEDQDLTRVETNDTNVAVVAEEDTPDVGLDSAEPKRFNKARRLMKSVFHS